MAIPSPAFFAIPNSPGNAALLASNDPGQVFTFKGTDFLSPNTTLKNINQFGKSIDAGGTDIFGKNPSSRDILTITANTAQSIFSSTFGLPVTGQTASASGTANGAGAGFLLNNNGLSLVTQSPSPALLSDLANFNPNIWQNPSATNVNFGIMDATNKLFGGSGLFPASVSTGSTLFPFFTPPPPPFSQLNIPINGTHVTTLDQAQLFPVTAETGSPFFITNVTPLTGANGSPNTVAQLFNLLGSLLASLQAGATAPKA